jgi:hypothetical protein
MGVAALTLAGVGTAAAQTVYVERITPAPTYVAPAADIDGYVIEQRVPVAPVVTYERQVVTPRVAIPQQRIVREERVIRSSPRATQQRVITERRVVTEPPMVTAPQPTIVTTTEPRVVLPADDDTTYVTDTDAVTTGVSSCSYDAFGRMICD